MKYFGGLTILSILIGLFQTPFAATIEDKYEPMVAFICDRPAMHRGVNGWEADKNMDCPSNLQQILEYCQSVYPDHNITNVVEASYLVDIPDWPMGTARREHPHRVRPFRCLVGGFQSDALLVPQHCEFDHRHDVALCEKFSHWNEVADVACTKKGMHLESLGMLLYCKLGHFSGVEYVCCPNETEPREHPSPKVDDKPDAWPEDSDDDVEDETEEDEEDSDDAHNSSSEETVDDGNVANLYEAYLRSKQFPSKYNNEHKRFLAAKRQMLKDQKHKVAQLLQQWQKARDHVKQVNQSDPKTAEAMNKEIGERFQRLYAAYEQEDAAEKQQLVALHQQHVQANLNERKRDAMEKYMKALTKGDVDLIIKYLHSYIKAEEKDRMHTINHFEHIKYTNAREALRIHPHIVNHLKLSEERIDQALGMLNRFPEIEEKVKPEIQEFLKRFAAIADSIRNVVLPVPEVEDEEDVSVTDSKEDSKEASDVNVNLDHSDEGTLNVDEDPLHADNNVHHLESSNNFVAHAQSNTHQVRHGLKDSATSGGQIGSTIGIALGSVSVFVIIVVAVIMLKRQKPRDPQGYVHVDPMATAEERHVTNMQMNGYENPTYKYFEVQTNPKA